MKIWITYKDELIKDSRDFELETASLGQPNRKFNQTEFELDCNESPKIVYVVVVCYNEALSGYQIWEKGRIEGGFLDEDEAEAVVDSIEKKTYTSPLGYNIWEGYYTSFESVNYHPVMVRKYPMR